MKNLILYKLLLCSTKTIEQGKIYRIIHETESMPPRSHTVFSNAFFLSRKMFNFEKITCCYIAPIGPRGKARNPGILESCGILWNPVESCGIHRNPPESMESDGILESSV
jgi:hypothetical protein